MGDGPVVASVAEAAGELHAGPIERFVADRDALVKQVRAAGRRDLADAIKELRKPTVAADALNKALRADPEAVERLIVAVAELRRTQEAMLAGEAADFAAHQTAYRQAIEAVVANAPSHDVEVRAAVEAAAIGGLHDELRAGTFALPPRPTAGFGPFAPGAGSVEPGARGAQGRRRGGGTGAPGPADPTGSSRPPSAAERRMAERARRAAEQAVAEAEADHRSAVGTARSAGQTVDELDRQLADLAHRIEAARQTRDDAVAARAKAEAALAAAADRLDRARSALDEL